jgi:hypothetical protein
MLPAYCVDQVNILAAWRGYLSKIILAAHQKIIDKKWF